MPVSRRWGRRGLTLLSLIVGLALSPMGDAIAASTLTASRSSSPQLISQQPPTVILQQGDSGEAVSALQRRLTELGFYEGPISGFFGELTEAAVIAFQRDRGLAVDGIVGTTTTNALRRSSTTSTSNTPENLLTVGTRGEAVTALQRRLQTLGYYDGPITGYYGPLTQEAVRRFQQANDLAVDGIAGPATTTAIDRAARSAGDRTPDPNDGLLERGESGEEVANIQRRLQALEYYEGPIDGEFGPQTEAAVLQLQRSQELTPDGIVGPATLAAMNQLEQSASNAATGSASASAPDAPTETATSPSSANGLPPSTVTPSSPSFPTPSATVSPQSGPPQVVVPPLDGQEAFPPADAVGTIPPGQPNLAPPTPVSPVPEFTPAASADRDTIMQLQRQLQEQGFYNGPIDGVMGAETQRAINEARRAYGLEPADFTIDTGL